MRRQELQLNRRGDRRTGHVGGARGSATCDGRNRVSRATAALRRACRSQVSAGWRSERRTVVQPPTPTGAFTFNAVGSDLPGVANTGTPLASFLLGQVQNFSIDLQTSTIQERAHFQEYFVQDDWKIAGRLTINP